MERAAQALLGVVFAMAILAWAVPRVAAASGRPRFVVALAAGAVAWAAFEAWNVLSADSGAYQRFVLGVRLEGVPARVLAAVNAASCAMLAVGLWSTRAWARLFAMGYLGFVIGSFLLWGVRDSNGTNVTTVMLWQMFVLPFLIFGLMYLQRGARFFKR
jgi:hypothetical protein